MSEPGTGIGHWTRAPCPGQAAILRQPQMKGSLAFTVVPRHRQQTALALAEPASYPANQQPALPGQILTPSVILSVSLGASSQILTLSVILSVSLGLVGARSQDVRSSTLLWPTEDLFRPAQ